MSQFDRFKDAPWFKPNGEEPETVIVGGAGGISSWLVFLLSRANINPIVFDGDIIEPHNIGGQLYKRSDIGKAKVLAIHDIIRDFSETSITTFNEMITPESMSHYFMMSGFDNMEARKIFYENWKRSIEMRTVPPILIDGRLEMENLQIFCVTPETMEIYEQEYLFEDSEVDDAPCSLRQTSHSAAMIAAHMVGFMTNHLTNIYERQIVREVPFLYEYFIPLNLTIS